MSVEKPLSRPSPQMDPAGIPAYPGASQKAVAKSTDSRGDHHVSEQLATSDSVEQVAKFYEDKLGFTSTARDGAMQLGGRTKEGAYVLIKVAPEDGLTKITVKSILYASGAK